MAARLAEGTSKTSKRSKNLKDMMQAGELEMQDEHTARLEGYKQRVRLLDPDAAFEYGKAGWRVRHSRCFKWYRMAEPYSATKFRSHCKSCVVPAAGGPQKTLTGMFGMNTMKAAGKKVVQAVRALRTVSTSRSPSPSIGVPAAQQIPCSGITEAIEPRLKSYFARSGASGGGSHSLKVFTEELFPGRKYKRLKPDEQEQVKLAQLHGQKFVKIDTQRAVFSKTCLKSIDAASVPRGTPFPSICNKCRDVLRDRQFRQALRRSVPLPENFRFNNKQYRNETAGHLFAKCSQLQEILNEVRTAIDSF
jgi:hypothetical protein